jgi:hypothetical protein
VLGLTRQQQVALTVLLLLLVVGWGVRAWRTARPAPAAGSVSVPP